MVAAIALALTACAKSFDMPAERLTPLRPEGGIVIGSVLVKAADDSDATYQFDIVQSLPGSPDGGPNSKRCLLEAKAGEERTFVSSLREGKYLKLRAKKDRRCRR
jgi:hypothetical protein